MDLLKVEPEHVEARVRAVLQTLFSEDETEELVDAINLEIEDGSSLYMFINKDEDIGFLVVTPLTEEDSQDNPDLISVEDIFVKSNYTGKEIADAIASKLKKMTHEFNVNQIEVIVSQSLSWLSESLNEHGYISTEVKLEKILPRSNNLDDVLELVQDCTPIDRIVQVLLDKDGEFIAEIVESSDEIENLLTDGWIPVMVVVTYEPEGLNIEETINESHQLINWDDYSVVYNARG